MTLTIRILMALSFSTALSAVDIVYRGHDTSLGKKEDGSLVLKCFKNRQYSGEGYYLTLPKAISAGEDFEFSAIFRVSGGSLDQGIKCALSLLPAGERVGSQGRSLSAYLNIFKGITPHAIYQEAGESRSEAHDWKDMGIGNTITVTMRGTAGQSKIDCVFATEGKTRRLSIDRGNFPLGQLALVGLGDDAGSSLEAQITIQSIAIGGKAIDIAGGALTAEKISSDSAIIDSAMTALIAQERKELPNPGTPFFNTAELANFPLKSWSLATMKVVEVSGKPFTKAIQVEILNKPEAFHSVQVRGANNSVPIRKGDVVFIAFSARCLKSTDDSHEGYVEAAIVVNSPTWTSFGRAAGSFGAEWKRIYGYAVAGNDCAPGELRLHLFFSHRWQTVEVGAFNVLNLGPVDPKSLPANRISYPGRNVDAPWRQAAEERIEKYRKAELTVIATDTTGHPIADAHVHFAMKRHAYGFGCYAENPIVQNDENADRYREWFKRLFNKAVAPLFWGPGNATTMSHRYGWENPRYREEYTRIARWLSENRIAVNGHVLVWPSFGYMPPDVRELSSDCTALKNRIRQHIADITEAVRPYVNEWQVMNEAWGSQEIFKSCGREIMLDWFQTARSSAPAVKLFINDNSAGGTFKDGEDFYFDTMKFLTDNRAPVDGIGWQCHYGSELVGPERLLSTIDRFAAFGKELMATEFTVNIDDEAAQADYTRDFYTAFFSHPLTSGIITWGFWEGRHYDPKAALIRKDWSLKSNGVAYTNLVFGKWWTDVNGTTGTEGKFSTRGFLGEYEITVSSGGKTKTIPAILDRKGSHYTISLD